MSDLLKVRNWDRFQQYKDGRPMRWIKLMVSLLDDYDFAQLTDTQRFHLIGIWLLAGRTGNKIPSDPTWIKAKIGASSSVDVDGLVQAGYLSVRDRTEAYESVPRGEESREEKRRVQPLVQDAAAGGDPGPETVLFFPVRGQDDDWELLSDKLAEWQGLYPEMDVMAECRKARQWLLDNPTRMKTARGMTRYLGSWLSGAQDRGRYQRRDAAAAGSETDAAVEVAWEHHLSARRAFYGEDPAPPTLTPQRRDLIAEAIRVHGERKAQLAGRGIFLSDWHTGSSGNGDGEEKVRPELVWKITEATDNVDRFATLALEALARRGQEEASS